MQTIEKTSIELISDATSKLLADVLAIESSSVNYLDRLFTLARKLGAYYRPDGLTEIGFWVPGLIRDVLHEREIYLEVFTPLEDIDWRSQEQRIKFKRDRLNLEQQGEFFWGVVSGMQAGTKEKAGSFYWLRYIDKAERLRTVRDLVPYSLPYGIFAPAELYDMDSLQANRSDLEYFHKTGTNTKKKIPTVGSPTNILQIHIGTASESGTIEGLTQIYKTISEKITNSQALTSVEKNYVGYDAIELLPTEPTIEFRDEYTPESEFFSFVGEEEDFVEIELTKPHTQDWGYDVPILGSSTTNPSLLGSLRPDEVVDFIATLHNFPERPIQLIYDLVYGHADNQSELLLSRQFLKGPNMYGQDLNHQFPMVRAMLLEMQRRKINTGADGIRVDGGQDFRFFNPFSGKVEQDDAYLLAMGDMVQEIDGYQRHLFVIFEDGRPWPEEGWEEKSRYRELIEMSPDSYQWGPLIFAHNTPTITGFWHKKWSRVLEVMTIGDRWITGCGNHDTLRRGNQVDLEEPINWELGANLPQIFKNAYDNPAITTWVYGFSPGLPMDFINAIMRVPWMFFRNTDEQYGVKVVSEEMGFLDWQITPSDYQKPNYFPRLKSLGFKQLKQLQEFGRALAIAMYQKDYEVSEVVDVLRSCAEKHCIAELPPLKELMRGSMVRFLKKLDYDRLQNFALMFMEDCQSICNVAHHFQKIDPIQTDFNLSLREFRRHHLWIAENMGEGDSFDKLDEEERMIFYGVRYSPDKSEGIALVSHLEGKPITLDVEKLLQIDGEKWEIVISSPGLKVDNLTEVSLDLTQALLLKLSK